MAREYSLGHVREESYIISNVYLAGVRGPVRMRVGIRKNGPRVTPMVSQGGWCTDAGMWSRGG